MPAGEGGIRILEPSDESRPWLAEPGIETDTTRDSDPKCQPDFVGLLPTFVWLISSDMMDDSSFMLPSKFKAVLA